MPNTVQDPIVGLGLEEAVDGDAREGQQHTGQVVFQQLTPSRMQPMLRYGHFDLLVRGCALGTRIRG